MLALATLASENAAFLGADESQAAAVASRVLGSAGTASAVVRPGVEVRSTGSLTVASDWQASAAAARSDSSPAITLRAAGDLIVSHGLSTGLAPVADAVGGASAALAPLAGPAGALRLTAGADLAAALPGARTAGGRGQLVIGRAALSEFEATPQVAVASSTGRIELAAAGDIQLLNNHASVYTTGLPVAALPAALLDDLPESARSGPGGTLLETPFLAGGSGISLNAGRDVIGVVAGSAYITDWWWRSDSGVWYSRFQDRFNTGVATFGGGDIRVQAGRDVRDLNATAVNSGNAAIDRLGLVLPAAVYGGGSVSVVAGRDVASGLVSASGDTLLVRAGGAIQSSGSGYDALHLDYQSTQVRVEAAAAVTLGSVRAAGRLEQLSENPGGVGSTVTGLSDGASLFAASWGGPLNYNDLRNGGLGRAVTPAVSRVIPAAATFAAPSGGINLGGITQQPVDGQTASLAIVAQGDARLASVLVQPAVPAAPVLTRANAGDPVAQLASQATVQAGDEQALAPVRVVAQQGDLTLTAKLQVARPLRLLAGRDLVLADPAAVLVSHADISGQPAPLSLLEAGRDIRVDSGTQLPFGTVVVRGAGDLVLRAGRDIDLGRSGGVVSRGNLDDSLGLPSGGAHLTLLVGSQALGPDYTLAARRGFVLLGGAGVASHAGELAALLQAEASGTAAPAVGGSGAQAFDARKPAEQLTAVATLLGTAAFNAALVAQVQALSGSAAAPTAEAARSAFAALAAVDQARVVGNVLATAFDTLPDATRQAFIVRLAAAPASVPASATPTDVAGDPAARSQALLNFLQARTGQAPASLSQAQAEYERLPAEQQALLANAVLVDTLRSAGRAAAALAGDARNAAYARGYAALAAVFPGVRPAGSLQMSSSQTKTQQGGSITLMAPGGGINAGALAATTATAANTQGIVTVAGGDIQAAVRDDFAVNQSRVFTLAQGNVLLWSSQGNLDAGRGAKTVRGAPAPVYGLDANGNVTVDTSGSFTGSGIAVLDARSTLDLYAPKGEINAGEAGIKSAGNAYFGANRIVGADNLAVGGQAVGAPPPPPEVGATAGLAAAGQSLAATPAASDKPADDADNERRKRRRRNLFLDFLGFGRGD